VRVQRKRGRDLFCIADLFADERCTKAILEFLESTDVGKKAGKEEWEQASDGTAEEQEVGVEGVKELMEVVRGREKHVHSKQRSSGHLYKCLCASASV